MTASSSAPAQRPRSRYAAGLPAVTADRITEEALRLTAEHGLENWTLRQLASALNSYPSVVYHHVGDREAVVSLVIERVVRLVPLPVDRIGWREWFRVLLGEIRTVLRSYRGVARRLAVVGPTATSAGEIIDTGIRLLQEAGFGEESVLTYNLLVSTTCLFVAIEDDRDGTVEARQRMAASYAAVKDQTDMPGLAVMGQFVQDLVNQRSGIDGYYASFYDYAIQRCLDGVEYRLQQIKAT